MTLDAPFANLSKASIPAEFVDIVPRQVALDKGVLPIARKNETLYVAMARRDCETVDDALERSSQTIEELRSILGEHRIELAVADPNELRRAIERSVQD